MAGSRHAEQAPGGVLERDQVVETKVTIPRLRPDSLLRPRLLEALDEGAARELFLVCTPAGFGKTTLIAEWARGAELPVAWLSLDPEDNDPVRFWRYAVEALDRAFRGLGESLLPLLAGSSVRSTQGVVAALINEAEDLPQGGTLVLDDYHLIHSASIHEDMTFLLTHPSSRLRIVLATRSDPPLPLARFRAGGHVAELRAAELRFTPDEAADFMREVWGLDLSPDVMAGLEARTEGWVVGLQLAALSLRQAPDPNAFLAAFTGTHRYVLDYLSEEVLGRVPDELRTFLLRTSILDRLSGSLCDAVTAGSNGQEMLETIERANLFLVPLDEERRWWRYHHLFAELLRSRLSAVHPEEVPELHGRAASWSEEHGLVDDAVSHFLLAGDLPRAALLVERNVEELLLRRSERATLDRWLAALPADVVSPRRRLVLAEAIAAQLEVRSDDALALLRAGRAPAETEDQHQSSVGRAASVLSNLAAVEPVIRADIARLQGDPQDAASFAQEALSHLTPEDELLSTFVRYHLAVADWMLGRLDPAERGLTEVVGDRRAAGERYLAVRASYDLGLVQQAAGRLGDALRTYRKAIDIITEPGRPPRSEAGLALVGMAEVMRERGDTEQALRLVVEGIERCRRVVYPLPLVSGLVTLGWIRQGMGDKRGAMEAVEEAERLVPDPKIASLHNPAPPERCRLLLLQGRVEEAVRWVEERGSKEADELAYPRERDYLALARVLLAHQDPDRALRLLDRLETPARAQGRTGSVVRIQALRSMALQSVGDHAAALSVLTKTLSVARAAGYVRVFADEGPAMAALLRSLITAGKRGALPALSGAAAAHVNRIIRAFGPQAPRRGRAGVSSPSLIVPLTERELEVLRLLASGKRNREIARELVVTLDTVKKHVSHIFEKLGAANRTEAVARAREIGIVS
jgi:LuxR family maltose regulon positive regulatory protein